MKKKMLLTLVALAMMGTVVISGASAARGEGIWYTDGDWAIACGPITDGALKYMLDANVPPGYTILISMTRDAASHSRFYTENKWIEASGLYSYSPQFWVVPFNGWIELTHEVYSPEAKLLTSARAYANCVTGEVKVGTINAY